MKTSEIANLLFRTSDKVHFYWNVYVIANIALFTGLSLLNEPLELYGEIMLTVGFFLFCALNIHGLYIGYGFLHDFGLELKGCVETETFTNPKLIARVNKISFRYHFAIACFIHAFVDTAMIITIWRT